jgi:hypothetical protein
MARKPLILIPLLTVTGFSEERPTGTPGGGIGLHHLPENRKPPVGPAISDEAFLELRKAERFSGFKPDTERVKGWDLLSHSDILVFGNDFTILPRGAVLHVPKKLAAHRADQVTGRLLPWTDFVARYRGVVTYLEVTLEQASGKKAIEPAVWRAATETGRIVVAVLNHHPISVVSGNDSKPIVDSTPPAAK